MYRRSLVTALLLCSGATLWAQSEPKTYLSVFCIKATPGKMSELETFVQDAGKRLAQVQVDAGRMSGWTFSRAVAPMGERARCDYVMAYTYDGAYPEPENSLQADLEKAGVNMTREEFLEKRNSLSKLIHHERLALVEGFGRRAKGDYYQVNFMKPHQGKTGEFFKFEREVWMPLAKAAADDNHARKAWSCWHVMYPSGSKMEYDAVTVDTFRDWKSIWGPQSFSKELVDKLHPGKTIQEVMAPVGELRDIVRRELYVVRDAINSPAMASRETEEK
jgi:hypothetical protein